ncbi:uncharacterized protein LOC127288300 [Leptopilina boulardi]|uniref:uncharacterized protein LOC127288300 n=1 Tax=Leptopilina boulardi TaxID=63433 RepID=UPI0021F578C3|nr:uncharacterized protein LOC127288300 [Leptopilina boulardi]
MKITLIFAIAFLAIATASTVKSPKNIKTEDFLGMQRRTNTKPRRFRGRYVYPGAYSDDNETADSNNNDASSDNLPTFGGNPSTNQESSVDENPSAAPAPPLDDNSNRGPFNPKNIKHKYKKVNINNIKISN